MCICIGAMVKLFDGVSVCASVVTEYVPIDRRVSGCVCVQCRRCISAAIRVTTNQFLIYIYIYIRASDACAGQ